MIKYLSKIVAKKFIENHKNDNLAFNLTNFTLRGRIIYGYGALRFTIRGISFFTGYRHTPWGFVPDPLCNWLDYINFFWNHYYWG